MGHAARRDVKRTATDDEKDREAENRGHVVGSPPCEIEAHY